MWVQLVIAFVLIFWGTIYYCCYPKKTIRKVLQVVVSDTFSSVCPNGLIPIGEKKSYLGQVMLCYLGSISPKNVPGEMKSSLDSAVEKFRISVAKEYSNAFVLSKEKYLADLTAVVTLVEALAVGPTLNHLVNLLKSLKEVGYERLQNSLVEHHYHFGVIEEINGTYEYLLFRLYYSQSTETHKAFLMLANLSGETQKVNCSQICSSFSVRKEQLSKFVTELYGHYSKRADPQQIRFSHITPQIYFDFCAEMPFEKWVKENRKQEEIKDLFFALLDE
jgi:hypothetical protein